LVSKIYFLVISTVLRGIFTNLHFFHLTLEAKAFPEPEGIKKDDLPSGGQK
jgi:hypothetical protein